MTFLISAFYFPVTYYTMIYNTCFFSDFDIVYKVNRVNLLVIFAHLMVKLTFLCRLINDFGGDKTWNSILNILSEFEPKTSENTSFMTIFFNIFEKSLKKYFLKVGQILAVFKIYYFPVMFEKQSLYIF